MMDLIISHLTPFLAVLQKNEPPKSLGRIEMDVHEAVEMDCPQVRENTCVVKHLS